MKRIILLVALIWGVYYCWGQEPELVIQNGHLKENYLSIAISPLGDFLVTAGADWVVLWDRNGKVLRRFSAHSEVVTAVAFSPNGQYFLTGSLDRTARLWDLSGRKLLTLSGHSKGIFALAFSPDGNYILTGSGDYSAKLWDLTGKELSSFEGHSDIINSVGFSSNGQVILTASIDHSINLWQKDGTLLQSLKGHNRTPFFATFSADDQFVFSADDDQVLKWKLTGELLENHRFERPFSPGTERKIFCVAFSPERKLALTGDISGTVLLHDSQGNVIDSLLGHSSGITSLDFSSNGKNIVTADQNGIVKLWDLNGRELQHFEGLVFPVNEARFSPDGQSILTASNDNLVGLWNLGSTKVQTFAGHSNTVTSVAFSPDGTKVLSADQDNSLKLWDIKGQELQSFSGQFLTASSVAFSPDGQFILSGEVDGIARVWLASGKEWFQLQEYDCEAITALTFSPDGDYILLGCNNGKTSLWNSSNMEIQYLDGHRGAVTAVAVSPNGSYILTGSNDSTVVLWNFSGDRLLDFPVHSNRVTEVAFFPDGRQILTGSSDGLVKIWDFEGREKLSFSGHNLGINSVDCSPDGRFILSSGRDGTVKLWDAGSGKLLLTLYAFAQKDVALPAAVQWLMVRADNYYMGSRALFKYAHFKIGLTAYSFEQFDLRLNRPDKVLETLIPFGVDTQLIAQYRQAYYKRLEKFNFTEAMLSNDYHLPECTITNADELPTSTTEGQIQIQIEATDTLRLLDRLNVFVNDVPIYGIQGLDLRNQNTQEYHTTLDVLLSRQVNKIQVSVLNQAGAESFKATTYITYDAPETKPDLYLMAIGVSDYQAEGKDLQYAAKDALDIAGLYRSAKGFGQMYTRTLTDEQVTKANILALRQWLESTGVDDQVLLYVSGHGLIDDNYDFYYATHDTDFANPVEKGILYDEIEGLLDGIPARKKLLLMDACHSGEFDEEAPPLTAEEQQSLTQKGVSFKGFSKGDDEGGPTLGLQNSFELMQQLFADLRRGSGATVITSSAGVQVSYEDADWQNGAFTYAFLYGLKTMKADTNKDGQVTASEIQAFVAEYVPQLTEGLQVPTFRRENLVYDFRVW